MNYLVQLHEKQTELKLPYGSKSNLVQMHDTLHYYRHKKFLRTVIQQNFLHKTFGAIS